VFQGSATGFLNRSSARAVSEEEREYVPSGIGTVTPKTTDKEKGKSKLHIARQAPRICGRPCFRFLCICGRPCFRFLISFLSLLLLLVDVTARDSSEVQVYYCTGCVLRRYNTLSAPACEAHPRNLFLLHQRLSRYRRQSFRNGSVQCRVAIQPSRQDPLG
jgi:hypothetical protein